VSTENRAALNVLRRSPDQRLEALVKANEIRHDRAQLKRELAAGTLPLAQILVDPPRCASTAKLRDLLLACPGLGPTKTDRLLSRCRIAHTKTVAGITERQRTEVLNLLRQSHSVAPAEEAAIRADLRRRGPE
jgi:guanylate kinase